MRLASILVLLLPGLITKAQTPAPAAPVATASGVAPVCPSSFYALGVGLNRAATPQLSGIFAVATPVTKCGKSFQVYSFTEHNIIPMGSGKNLTFKEVTTTGFATPLRQVGPIDIYAFGNVGVSTNGKSAGFAGAYGVLGSFSIWPRFGIRGLLAAQKVDGFNVYDGGIGRSW